MYNVLTSEDLRRISPSVFAPHARPGVSDRYTFVSTSQVVDLLRGEGWEPVLAREQRVRLPERVGFQTHELRFTRREHTGERVVGEVRPELVLQNAHDGTRAYRIDAGLYRLVCRNGLVVADSRIEHIAIRHCDVSADTFLRAAESMAQRTAALLPVVDRWRAVTLSDERREHFAQRAIALRWDESERVGWCLPADKVLTPLRPGDAGGDLWRTFNVVQEHLLRGGDGYRRITGGFRRHTTRPVVAIDKAQALNKALWALAEEFARN